MKEEFINEYRARRIIIKIANIFGFLLFVLPFIIGSYKSYQTWISVGLFISVLAVLKYKLTGCPGCRKHISQNQWRYSVHPPNSCPHCGVVLLPLPENSEPKTARIVMSAGFLPIGVGVCLAAYASGLTSLYYAGGGLSLLSISLVLFILHERSPER